MAIKGISEKRILPRLGKIKTGIKKKLSKNKEHPEEVPYFVLNPVEEVLDKEGRVIGTQENNSVKKMIELYGEKPTQIKVCFPVDDMSLCADPYMKWWGGNVKAKKATIKCIGDGEFAHYQGHEKVQGMIPQNERPGHEVVPGKPVNRICNKDECPQAQAGSCKPNMNLRVVIPEVSLFGVFQIDTTSYQSMEAILSSIDVARNALQMKGINSIAGVPLTLYRERTPNKHNNVNYIMKIRVDEEKLAEETKKLTQREPSTLLLGNSNIKVEPLNIEEPNFDLIPKSLHGAPQTGELDGPKQEIENTPAQQNGPDQWIQNGVIRDMFMDLGALMSMPVTDAKMLATAKKMESEEELKTYLQGKIDEASPKEQPQA